MIVCHPERSRGTWAGGWRDEPPPRSLDFAANEPQWSLPSSGLRPPSPRGRRAYARAGPLPLGEGGRRPGEGELDETFITLLIGSACRSPGANRSDRADHHKSRLQIESEVDRTDDV